MDRHDPDYNPLTGQDPDEQLVCEIKRHPIGIMGNYVVTLGGLVVLAFLGYGLIIRFATTDSKNHLVLLFTLLLVAVTVIAATVLFVATTIYWKNRWIVNSDSITQIQQRGLFQHQSSQLSMANLEDVVAEQNGMLASMFNFGVLRVETAGEHAKFRFIYCPNPTYYARQILTARNEFIRNDPAMAKRANDLLTPPEYPSDPSQPTA